MVIQMKPIEGAESEGALGFFKGVGKGLVGYGSLHYAHSHPVDLSCSVVTKPVVGVLDLASNVSEGQLLYFLFFAVILTNHRYTQHNYRL